MKDEVAKLRADREERERKAEELRKQAETSAEAKRQEELSAKELLAEQNKQWEDRFATLQNEREQEKALLDKERQYLGLQQYIQRRVGEEVAAETIAEDLVHYVTGNSEAEVEASIEKAKQTTASILEQVQAVQQQARQRIRGVSPTGYAPVGPMDTESANQSLSVDDLKNMSMADYVKIRDKLGVGSSGPTNKGMFG